jgi:hypothetical protein
MATFIFRRALPVRAEDIKSTESSAIRARDRACQQHPQLDLHDETIWPMVECWEGGKCLWHLDDAGRCTAGPRPTPRKD